jgi:solute carrier family 26 (sodium-independent sulfate anion transporter), member 11
MGRPSCRGYSYLFTTRSLVDTPLQFHFATILSPWIHRALIAAGFGIGTPAVNLHREIAPVVPYRGGRRDKWDEVSGPTKSPEDIEAPDATLPHVSGTVPIVDADTPFFHFDLTSAVRAAEAGLEKPTGAWRSETPPMKYT